MLVAAALQICKRKGQLEKGVFSQVVTEIGAKFAQKNFLILPYLYNVDANKT